MNRNNIHVFCIKIFIAVYSLNYSGDIFHLLIYCKLKIIFKQGDISMKLWLISGAVFAFLSVALGAFGAHALKQILNEYGKSIWDTAVQYQMFHALALLVLGLLQAHFREINFSPAGWAFIAGIFLFSGSLFVLSVSGIKILGAVTPLGGLAFLFAWIWLIYCFIKYLK